MAPEFKHLFTPLQIGSTTVKNRLMMGANSNDLWRLSPDGYNRWNLYGERANAYYSERAKGGFGLIMMGQAMVHKNCGTNRPAAFLQEAVDAYKPITASIHKAGAKTFMQLNHNSRGRVSGTDDWDPVLATKPGASFYAGGGGQLTKEIELEEIQEIIDGFAISARNMQLAGYDGVEIQCGHSYLISELLTPAYNRRKDQYGGPLENRARMAFEVIDAVRKAVGDEFTVGVRLNAWWDIPDGFPNEEAVQVAKWMEESGKVNFIDVTAWDLIHSMAPMGTGFGLAVSGAAAIKKALKKTPVFVVGRIVDPVHAEQIIAEGQADVVNMVRQAMADPELPNKAREGRLNEIRTCIGGSQGCNARHTSRYPITCTQNPTVGREAEWGIGTLNEAPRKKKVLVAGAGPAGMEAAIVARKRGHEVILCELGSHLGGQINLILKNPRRGEFVNVIEWRKGEIDRLGIDLRLNTTVTAEMVKQIGPDAVVVATGSVPYADNIDYPVHWSPSNETGTGIPGADKPHVYTPWDVLHGAIDDKQHVVVYDGIGYYQASDPVEYLLQRDKKVTALSAGPIFAVDMVYVDRPAFVQYLRGKDITFQPYASIREIGDDSMRVLDTQTGRESTIDGVDAVVVCVGNAPANKLYYDLKGTVDELYRIGDCVVPRRVEHAHFQGQQVGRAI